MEKCKDVKKPVGKKGHIKEPDHQEQQRFTDEKRKRKEVKDQTVGGF